MLFFRCRGQAAIFRYGWRKCAALSGAKLYLWWSCSNLIHFYLFLHFENDSWDKSSHYRPFVRKLDLVTNYYNDDLWYTPVLFTYLFIFRILLWPNLHQCKCALKTIATRGFGEAYCKRSYYFMSPVSYFLEQTCGLLKWYLGTFYKVYNYRFRILARPVLRNGII